jgi:hypothetical protein
MRFNGDSMVISPTKMDVIGFWMGFNALFHGIGCDGILHGIFHGNSFTVFVSWDLAKKHQHVHEIRLDDQILTGHSWKAIRLWPVSYQLYVCRNFSPWKRFMYHQLFIPLKK